MGLVRSLDEILRRKKHFSEGYKLGEGVMVMVTFRTKAEVVERVLPPPLEPALQSIGLAYVIEFHRTNFGVTYGEGGLYVSAQHKGEVGKYCLSMPVTNDMALIWGREIYGYPKKIAEVISVNRDGNKVTGVCIRKKISIIKIKLKLVETIETETILQPTPNYLFKYFWNPEGRLGTFDYTPRLIKQRNKIDWGKVTLGEGELTFAESIYDPLYEIPVEEVLTAYYAKGIETRMQPGEIIAEVDPEKFLPYSFIKYDWELTA